MRYLLRKPHLSAALVLASLAASQAHASLVAAVLPDSRSAEIGRTVTVFATLINAGTETATNCEVGYSGSLPLTLSYRTTDANTNAPIGAPDAPVDIAAGAAQSFVLAITPQSALDPGQLPIDFRCDGGLIAASNEGINTLLLSASDRPVPDIVALAATPRNDGVLSTTGNSGAFALATVNVGASGQLTVSADTGNAVLPVTLSVCETDAGSGACLAPPAASLITQVGGGATPTFSVFSDLASTIGFDPLANRVFVRFRDADGNLRGGTSVAIEGGANAVPASLSARAVDVLNRIFLLLLGEGLTSSTSTAPLAIRPSTPQPVNDLQQCSESGQLAVTGTIDQATNPATLNAQFDFQQCDGIDGMLSVEASVLLNGQTLELTIIENGEFSAEGCEQVVLEDFTVTTTANLTGELLSTTTASGLMRGRCEGVVFSCSLDEADVNDEASFEENCNLSP